jgi:hypothetical protein
MKKHEIVIDVDFDTEDQSLEITKTELTYVSDFICLSIAIVFFIFVLGLIIFCTNTKIKTRETIILEKIKNVEEHLLVIDNHINTIKQNQLLLKK